MTKQMEDICDDMSELMILGIAPPWDELSAEELPGRETLKEMRIAYRQMQEHGLEPCPRIDKATYIDTKDISWAYD